MTQNMGDYMDIIDDLKKQEQENTSDIVQEYPISKRYILNIDDDLEDPNNYRKVFDVLRKAAPEDEVVLSINTMGGFIHTFVQFFGLLMKCKAKTIAEVYTAYSAGAYLCLSCDEIRLFPFSSMMMHSISYAAEGKSEEIANRSRFEEKSLIEINKILFYGFLTELEIKEVNGGKDMWLTMEQISERLKNWVPVRHRFTATTTGNKSKKQKTKNGKKHK